jgi:hypothetical protein
VTNEKLKETSLGGSCVWTFLVLEAGFNVTDSELVAGFDRVLNAPVTKYGPQ